MKEESRDPEQLLKSYWHGRLDSLEAPPDLVDRALTHARHAGPMHVESRFGRPFKRAITGLAGMAVVGVLAFWAVSHHHGGISASSANAPRAQYHESAAGAAKTAKVKSSPSFTGAVAAFSKSTSKTLWAVKTASGQIQLWTKPASARHWHRVKTFPGTGSQVDLGFSGKTGWLLVLGAGGHWRAWTTQDSGKIWGALSLPAVAKSSTGAALSDVGGAPAYLALSRPDGRTALYRKSNDGWIREAIQGISGTLSAIRIKASGHGEALAGGALYQTQDGGRRWSMLAGSTAMAYTSANTKSAAAVPMPDANARRIANLQGLGSRVGGVQRVAYHGFLWQHQRHGWQRIGRLPAQGPVRSLTFVTVDNGYVLFKSGMIYVTHDGGASWVRYHNE